MESGVIEGKVRIPPVGDRYVARPRLEQRLAELIRGQRVVGISATAGAGKTTAVTAAVGVVGWPVAWLTLERTDTAPGRLVTYLEAALARPAPNVRGVATRALSAGIPHAEAAGLLAEALGETSRVLVLDQIDEIERSQAAVEVIVALLRYASPAVHAVLLSRRALPATLMAPLLLRGEAGALGERELAFTASEAAAALESIGGGDVDPVAAVEATGGWVTGVLFEAWRSAEHVAGAGGEEDPLYGYLSSHIIEQLEAQDRAFLTDTALLREVSAARAQALGCRDAEARLAALRSARLPVTWEPEARVLRCHPRFREYLLDRLERTGGEHVRELRLAHARLLAAENHVEEAVEEFLRAGSADAEARAVAERAITRVVERLDFEIAERWLRVLADAPAGDAAAFPAARLMIAFGRSEFGQALREVEALAAAGTRDALASGSALAAVLMAWAYALFCRFEEMDEVLAMAPTDPVTDAARYGFAALRDGPPPPRPPLTDGPLDAMVLASDMHYGRLEDVSGESASRWIDAISGARRVWMLRATGQTQRALELYEQARALGQDSIQLEAWAGPEVLIDAGRIDDARAAIARARRLLRQSGGSPMYEANSFIVEAKLELRLADDPAAARAALDRVEASHALASRPWVSEPVDTWYGLALLRQGEDQAALERLRRAVERMLENHHVLELPTAAVYLAEAEWRAGNEDAADRAADVALDGAHRFGSNHVLLQALADFPAVVSRRLDSEPAAGSAWHELGRALRAQGVALAAPSRDVVELVEFGRSAILVGGEEVRPRIAKSYELLAFLAARPGARAERTQLLEALFDARADEAARAYLRQAVLWLRKVLPDEALEAGKDGQVSLGPRLALVTDSVRLEATLAEAARLQGEERLGATLEALKVFDRGEYLPGVPSPWAEERRAHLREVVCTARHEAAELAFAAGRLELARALAEEVLREEPFHEAAWRLTMRLADALGDEAGVFRAYQRCEDALGSVGTVPSPTTRELLVRLRR